MSNVRPQNERAVVVEEVGFAAADVAEQVFSVRQCAYAQEAALLGTEAFPPLRVGIEELRASKSRLLVAREGRRIVGALQLDTEAEGLCIVTLVVRPSEQGMGIGSKLVQAALAAAVNESLEVQTAALNERAVNLYRRHGFEAKRSWCDTGGLELVRLRHPGGRKRTAA